MKDRVKGAGGRASSIPSRLGKTAIVGCAVLAFILGLSDVPAAEAGLGGAVGYPVGGSGNSFTSAVADLDHDGKLDVAVASGNEVAILLGNGNGSFQAPVSYGAGSSNNSGTAPVSVAVGDFNADGKADLAVANGGVAILLGNGDGSFQPAVSYDTGRRPTAVAVDDFNGDGHVDLVVANSAASSVSILLGNGNGTFQTAVEHATGPAPFCVSVGDFNGDGKSDLAVANSGSNDLSILLGNGNGSFQPAITYPTGSTPISVAVGDFNGDGKLDLAVAAFDFGDSSIGVASILLGNGDGTFQPAGQYATTSSDARSPLSIAVGDLNGDGAPDLALVNLGGVAILLGNGNATFQAAVSYGAGIVSDSVVVADFDGDGKQDLAIASVTPIFFSIGPGTLWILSGNVLPLPADLSITKTDGQATALAGSPITYTIRATNTGPNPATAVTITDTVPPSVLSPTWTCVGTGGGSCTASGTGSINDTVALPVDATVTYTLLGTVSPTASNLVNTATIAPSASTTFDPDPSDNSATDIDSPICNATTLVVVPDGRLTSGTIASGATAWLAASLRIGNSYSVEFTNQTDSSNPPGLLTVFRGDDGCSGTSTLTPTDTTPADPGSAPGSARVSFTATGTVPLFQFTLANGGPTIAYSVAVSDTTMFSPAWSTNGSFDTFYSFQNTTGTALNGSLVLLDSAGAVIVTVPLPIPAGQTASTNTSSLARGRTGTARFTHDGPPGAIVAEAAIANFSITPNYVQPVKFAAVREAR